jgi:hypothetical protein
MAADANIPEMFVSQLVDVQQKIEALKLNWATTPKAQPSGGARQQYSEALKAELSGDSDQSAKAVQKSRRVVSPRR